MKKLWFLILLLVLCPMMLTAQWLEATIYVPHSLCGVLSPHALIYSVINNRIYVGGVAEGDIRLNEKIYGSRSTEECVLFMKEGE